MNKIKVHNHLYFTILIILIFITSTSFSLHKYYVGLTHIEYNDKNKSVEIVLKLFTDDLELTLNNNFKKTFDLGTATEHKIANEAINNYINQKMFIKINGKDVLYTMIGKEFEDDMTLIYFEIKNVKNLKSIAITNNLFFEIFEDQQHIIKVKSKEIKKNIILFKDKNHELINL